MGALGYWILDPDHPHKPIQVDMDTWCSWFNSADEKRRVAATNLEFDTRVSTVFLGMNHSFSLDPLAPPILFETMIFSGIPEINDRQWRCSTWEQAEAQHEVAVREAEEVIKDQVSGHLRHRSNLLKILGTDSKELSDE